MEGRLYAWCLLTLTLMKQFFFIASLSQCASKGVEKLVPLVCEHYSCRNKCNTTVDAVLVDGSLQHCQCDERCVMFNDCCEDFASLCHDTFQDGKRKYPKFTTLCYSMGIAVVNGFIGPAGTHASTIGTSGSGTTTVTGETTTVTGETTTVTGETTTYGKMSVTAAIPLGRKIYWAMTLYSISRTKIDYDFRLLFLEHVSMDSYAFSPVQTITADLEVSKPFSYIEYLNESDDFISVRSLLSGIPENVRRKCTRSFFMCPKCVSYLEPELICQNATGGIVVDDSLKKGNDDDAKAPPCYLHFVALYKDPKYGTEQSAKVRQLEVTVIPDLPHGYSTIHSQDLPWSKVRCMETTEGHDLCEIRSCAVGRLLSPDGRACFIPTSISVLVDKRVKTVNRSNTSTILSLQESQRISTNMTNSQSPLDIQTVTPEHKSSASLDLCLVLYQVLRRHTGWTFKNVYIRQTCRYDFQFKSIPNADKRTNNLETSTVTSQGLASNSYQDNGEASQTKNNNKTSLMSSGNKSDYSNPFIHAKYEEEMLHAWNIIHNNVDAIPVTDDVLSIELCFEIKPAFPCNISKELESCQDVMSRCLVYSQLQSAPTTTTMNSFHRNLPWSWWIHLIFILYVFEELKE